MTSLNGLNLTADTKPQGKSEVVERRKRVVKSIQSQIIQIENELSGIEEFGRKKPSWYWMNDDGQYLVSLRYGKKPVELQKGKMAVVCDDLENVQQVLHVFKDIVTQGELDTKLEVIAKGIRSNFKK